MRTFRDSENREWKPVVNTPIIIRACRSLDITIAKVMSKEINVADVIELLWYTCEREAGNRKMSKEDFIDALSLDKLPEAYSALMTAVGEAFPQMEEVTQFVSEDLLRGPFVLGQLKTSSTSADTQESVPETSSPQPTPSD